MKRFVLTVVLLVTFILPGIAVALPFSDFVNWRTETEHFITITDSFEYRHRVNFDPVAQEIESAYLTLRHKGNSDNQNEVWLINDIGFGRLARLDYSIGEWQEQTIEIPPEFLEGIQGDRWVLRLRLHDRQDDVENILKIDWSRLCGEYTPVPEPSGLMLLGIALGAIAGFRRRMS